MKEYLSDTPIWHGSSAKISALNYKSILIVRSDDDIVEAHVQVETAPPYSPERGKVSVIVWDVSAPDEPCEQVAMIPTTTQKFSELGSWQKFVSQDALDLISPHNDPLLPFAELLLVIPNEPESSGR